MAKKSKQTNSFQQAAQMLVHITNERMGWMKRYRNIAAKYGASFDDLGPNELEQLARRVGIPNEQIRTGLPYEIIERELIEWAINQAAGAKPALPADSRPTGGNEDAAAEWSEPLPKTVIAKRLRVSLKILASSTNIYQLNQVGRQAWRLRLDTLDPGTRRRFELKS